MLEIILIVTVVCAVLELTTAYSAAREVRKNFTDEQWKVIKSKRKSKYAWYINALFIGCPILNFIMALAMGFLYREIIDTLTKEYRGYLTE